MIEHELRYIRQYQTWAATKYASAARRLGELGHSQVDSYRWIQTVDDQIIGAEYAARARDRLCSMIAINCKFQGSALDQ